MKVVVFDFDGTHCTGKAKVAELRRRFGILEWSTVYTNSFADSPLLSQAQDITLVCPSKRSLLATQRLIVPGTALRVLRTADVRKPARVIKLPSSSVTRDG